MIVLLGMTATGKSTILNKLVKDYGYQRIVTCTTRPKREGEVDGIDYHFLDDRMFRHYINQDKFIEYTSYNVVNNQTWYYGTLKEDLSKNFDNGIIIVNPDGYKYYSKYLSNAFFVRLYAPLDIIRKRLMERGDDPGESERRIIADCSDFQVIDNKLINLSINTHIHKVDDIAREINYEYTLVKDELYE